MYRMFSLLGCALICEIAIAAPKLQPGESKPEETLQNIVKTYESLNNDPYLKLGKIDEYFQRPELIELNSEDKKAFTHAIVTGNFPRNLKYKVEGSVLLIDDPKIIDNGKNIKVDFRDFNRTDHGTIFINDKPYELKFLISNERNFEPSLLKQIKDFGNFWASKSMQSYFPGLNDQQSLWAYNGMRAILFPFAILSGCSMDGVRGNLFAAGASIHKRHMEMIDKIKGVPHKVHSHFKK
jgi:hypothetical protein